jgi:hypothetical protein
VLPGFVPRPRTPDDPPSLARGARLEVKRLVRGGIGGEPPFICDACVEAIFLELFPLVRPEAGSPLTSTPRPSRTH